MITAVNDSLHSAPDDDLIESETSNKEQPFSSKIRVCMIRPYLGGSRKIKDNTVIVTAARPSPIHRLGRVDDTA